MTTPPPPHLSLDEEAQLVEAMRQHGGHFASNLALAWHYADGLNRDILREHFRPLLERYRPFLKREG